MRISNTQMKEDHTYLERELGNFSAKLTSHRTKEPVRTELEDTVFKLIIEQPENELSVRTSDIVDHTMPGWVGVCVRRSNKLRDGN